MIKRDLYLKMLIDAKSLNLINVVTGMRRSGKTTLIFNLFFDYLINVEKIKLDHILIYLLDDFKNKKYIDPHIIYNDIIGKIRDNKDYYLLIDEVQKINDFESVLNSFVGHEKIHVYVTGSNAKFLSKDVITEFRGRSHEIYVHPLSFKEYLSCQSCSKEQALDTYLIYGGLPQLLQFNDHKSKNDYLKVIFNNTYLIDILERSNIHKNKNELNELLNIVSSSIGSLTSPNKLSNSFKSISNKTLSSATIKKYLEWFKDSFLVDEVKQYSIKGKKYINSPSKFYFTDLGIRNAQINFRQIEKTRLLENLVFNELRIKGFNVDVGFVERYEKNSKGTTIRKRLEIDFVCNMGDKKYYVQVADNISSIEKFKQETKPLIHIPDAFEKIIITLENNLYKYTNDGIKVINIFDFLLNDTF